ncbi:translational activator of GCN4 [Lambiella insularis]|nr:translational activator of GCN4 [Lambiella insularis]
MDEASVGLRSSSTAQRIAVLESWKAKLPGNALPPIFSTQRSVLSPPSKDLLDLPDDEVRALLPLLLNTYPAYQDRGSRQAVQGCLQQLLATSAYCWREVTAFLVVESKKPGLAPTSAFVLVEWCAIAVQVGAADPEKWDTGGVDVVSANAQLLELCVSRGTRPSIKKSAVSVTRKAFRTLLKNPGQGVERVRSAILHLTQKSQLGYKGAILLGIVAGVCARSRKAGRVVESMKTQYFSFWVREVISSKTHVPYHIAVAFGDFFSNFTTIQDLQNEIVPALEKALLRAPEIVLDDLIKPMVLALPADVDLSEVLAVRLLKPLLSNVKSTDASIRNGAASTFNALVSRCGNETLLRKVSSEIQTPLITSKIVSADQRAIHGRMLSAIPVYSSYSTLIYEGLLGILSKEPNESAAVAESHAFVHHLFPSILLGTDGAEKFSAAFVRGLGDKRPAFQRIWALRTGDMLWALSLHTALPRSTAETVEALLPQIVENYNEVANNPLPASQTGLIVLGYVVASLAGFLGTVVKTPSSIQMLRKASLMSKALASGTKPSFLLNLKVYSKITSSEDFKWLVRALFGCSEELCSPGASSTMREAWTQALLYTMTASSVPFSVQKDALQSLTDNYRQHPAEIGAMIIEGLWIWYRHVELSTKDTAAMAARTGVERCYLVLRSICIPPTVTNAADQSINTDILQSQLLRMLVLCRTEVLPRANWIEMCLRVGQDPGKLVAAHSTRCIEHVNSVLSKEHDGPPSGNTKLAAYHTFAELAFVAPTDITPLLVEQITGDLSVEVLRQYGPTDFAIARTPEGTAFVDVLSSKSYPQTLDKSARDYDTLRWEAEVRAQLAAKKGQQKKISAEEQAKVNAQLAKEAEIRSNIFSMERNLERGIGIIHGLATGPPNDAGRWIGLCLRALLDVIEAGVGLLMGDSADKVYVECANFVSARVGTVRPFIGIATLRALGSSQLAAEFHQEPLGDLVTRILYRLRLTSEQRSFDSVSLNYIIPLICIVLQQHGVGQAEEDEADEQVTLALETLASHTENFSQKSLPRGEVLAMLVRSMQDFSQHYKLIKDCLHDLCRALASNIAPSETKILLRGVIVPQGSVRTAVLQAVREHIDLTVLDFSEEIWLASHDDIEENADLGNAIWEENDLEVSGIDAMRMIPYLSSPHRQLRRAASRALAACVAENTKVFPDVLECLQDEYRMKAKPRIPERDEYGMIRKTDLSDPWEGRSGIALAFKELAPIWETEKLVSFITFLIQESVVGDRNPSVRDEMIESATAVISAHGKDRLEDLMTMFETALEAGNATNDQVSEAIVILYGALARHLPSGDERVPQVVRKLLQTLSTPSETVQYAVASCLPPLIRTSVQNTSSYVQEVLDQLFQSKNYVVRRGAAYGLAGIVSGRGVAALREYRVMSTLKSAIDNKKDPNYRQGALFAFELFSLVLGRIFEPYIIQIVPQLLVCFGDANADVREACLDAAKMCFASLSSYGVKLILPTLLEGLDEPQWRSKKGACDLLGAMAYLDPQQLASSLPDIIPPLTNVLNDSHKEVRAAANRSLQRFGEVISNPEIKGLVGILLKALSDPTKYTDEALDALIKVSFIHYLDSPSLALVVRILERGLGDRSATKRKSAQIIGSLAHLTERKDLISHLPILVAGLKQAVVDPVPTTRATSSKALGSLVEKLGEDALPDLIPELMSTLKSDTGAGDRLGSAQALSEVLAGLGTGRLEETLPTILQNVASSKASIREGFMSLFIFLPACFGNSFAAYLNRIIPPILAGLADDVESIRETSLRAGRLLVKNFATKAIDLLLPELDRGLADDSYRIRLSSVELVGDLLFNLTGISGKADQEEGEDNAAEAGQSLLEVLGEDRRNKILSSLYICRCDTSGLVRAAAINVWKALVATPRTLKELIPTLTQLLIRRLASSNMEQKVIAGNALGELIRKAGEGVLATLLPTLEAGLQTSTDTDSKQGICIALREIISSAAPETLEDYEKTLISVVRSALVDPADEVRDTAADAFDSLQQIFGKRAVDQVLPYLLSLLRTEGEADIALSALLTLLTDNTRSNVILPNLVPTLLASPISTFNAKAIASLSQVAGSAMTRRLPAILNALMDNIVISKDEQLRMDLESSFDAILLSVDEFDGLNSVMSVMLALMKHEDHKRRACADLRLSKFFSDSEVDFSRYNQDLIRVLLLSFDDRDPDVVRAAWSALTEMTKHLRKEEMESLVFSTRQVLQQVGVAGSDLPGFCLPKGINAILPIFLQGLMNGTAEQRTQSALAISDIIDRTSPDALKPFVTNIAGPLIRVVSERSVDVKSAILLTLNNLLEKIPAFLKPFLPQLQRTFAKSLADTTSELLRSRAAKALGTLLTLKPRIDPLIAELVTGTKTTDPGVRNAMLKALYEVVSKAGANMSEASRSSILSLIDSDNSDSDDSMVITNARLLGALVKNLPPSDANLLIKQRALTTRFTKSSILNLNSIFLESPSSLTKLFSTESPSVISQAIQSRQPSIAENAVLAAGKYLLLAASSTSYEVTKPVFESLAAAVPPGNSVDTRRLSLVVLRTLARRQPDAVRPHLPLLASPVFASVRDPVIPVKLAAEAAFLALFAVVEQESIVFDKYMAAAGADLPAITKRSMQDYFKRVGLRLGAQARKRREAEGGQGGLGLSGDEMEDEREVWSVGKVELGEGLGEE